MGLILEKNGRLQESQSSVNIITFLKDLFFSTNSATKVIQHYRIADKRPWQQECLGDNRYLRGKKRKKVHEGVERTFIDTLL